MTVINFFCEEVNYVLSKEEETKKWIAEITKHENRSIGEINYVFCSDPYLHKINLEYLNHDDYTDIITFDNSEEKHVIEGDIFISIERVEENAAKYSKSYDEELRRVMAHGILHLIGYKDKTSSEAENMREKEDACLSLWGG